MHPTYVAFGSRGDKVGLKGMRLLLARPAACAAVRWQPGGNSVRCFQLAGQPVVMAGADCWFLLIQVVATYHGDHAYCFDITGAAQPSPPSHPGSSSSCASRQQQQPLDLFAHPLAAAALAAGGGGGHVKNGSSSGTVVPWEELVRLLSDERRLETDPQRLPATGYGPEFEEAASGIFVQASLVARPRRCCWCLASSAPARGRSSWLRASSAAAGSCSGS